LSKSAGAVIVASILAALAAGCGGEDESAARAALLRRLNASCLVHNRVAAAQILKVYDNPRVKRANSERRAINLEVSLFAPIVLADAEAQARAVRSVDMPSGDEEPLNAILDAYRAWIERAKRSPLRTVVANDVYNEARELARGYGLVKCGLSPFEVSNSAVGAGEAAPRSRDAAQGAQTS
jgi:hypothetical protein